MKFSDYQSSIVESLDRHVNYREVVNNRSVLVYRFEIGDVKYEVAGIKKYKTEADGSESTFVDFSFTANGKYHLRKSDDKTARITLATVIKIIFDYIESNKPVSITFHAYEDKDPEDSAKRLRLYTIMTRAKVRGNLEYDWDLSGKKFTVYEKNYKNRIETNARLTRVPVGIDTSISNSYVTVIDIHNANDFAFFEAFGIEENTDLMGPVAKGSLSMSNRTPTRAKIKVGSKTQSISTISAWRDALHIPVFDFGNGPEEDPTYRVGKFKRFYIVMSGVGILKVYTDFSKFMEYINPWDTELLNPEILK